MRHYNLTFLPEPTVLYDGGQFEIADPFEDLYLLLFFAQWDL
jgi:hypothetical protein